MPEAELPEIDPASLTPIDPATLAPTEVPALTPIDPADLEPLAIDDEPLSIEGGDDASDGTSKIRRWGGATDVVAKTEYKRALNLNGTGATRCKVFHSKIAIAPLEFMQKQINEWLDSDEIEAKFTTQVVGTMEGKRAEPNLIVTIWY